MSYDLYLCDPVTHETIMLGDPHHNRERAHVNVTFNYESVFSIVFPGLRGIYTIAGETGASAIPILRAAIGKLGDDVSDDYWAATEGNAKRALNQILALCVMRPDGIWRVGR